VTDEEWIGTNVEENGYDLTDTLTWTLVGKAKENHEIPQP
jgi:hypothetical protein